MHTKFLNNLKITFYCWQHIPSQNQNVKAPLTLFSAAVANQPSASRAWLSKSIYNLFLTFSDKSNEIFSMWQLCTESNIWTCVCMVNPSLLCPCPHSPFHWPQRERLISTQSHYQSNSWFSVRWGPTSNVQKEYHRVGVQMPAEESLTEFIHKKKKKSFI